MKLNNPLDAVFHFFDGLATTAWKGGWYVWIGIFLAIIAVWVILFK